MRTKLRGSRPQPLVAAYLVCCLVAAGGLVAGWRALAAEREETVLLRAAEFPPDLSGWQRRGPASFDVDTGQAYEGHASARITVEPETELQYQQLSRDFRQDVQPGDQMVARVRVRTRELSGDPGAYLALEFLGEGDTRAGIAHSRMGAGLGRQGWELLTAEGTAPEGTRAVRLSLILHAHGTAWFADPELARTGRAEAWPDLGTAPRKVVVHTGDVVNPRFGGVGFHAFHHAFPASQAEMDNVIYKRWRELNPSFVRLNDQWDWDRKKWDDVARHILRMKETGTEVYLTSWNPPDVKSDEEMAAYARKVGDNLEYLIRNKGATNLHYYCMTNELSLGGWGKLIDDLPRFRAYHQALYDEIQRRKLKVGLLATDASPLERWGSIEWAAANMDGITGVYGGHHYINDRTPDDERFYPWFLEKMAWGAGIARARKKDFILGEFGPKQDGRTLNGVLMDACIYWDTPQEPLVSLQVAEATLAALNGGIYALGYWTFMDFPDDYSKTYKNKWGIFRCSGDDRSTRPHYYAYGLLTRYFRGPSTVFRVETGDPRLRVAAVRHHDKGTWSIAVVNRNKVDVPLSLTLEGQPLGATFRKYEHDPRHPAQHPFGDLPPPVATVTMKEGRLSDTLGAGTLTVYTTAYDNEIPAAVSGLEVTRAGGGAPRLTWRPVSSPDLCYYRVYRGGSEAFVPDLDSQVGSTVATQFLDEKAPSGGPLFYKVLAVDQSGNAGPPSNPASVSGG